MDKPQNRFLSIIYQLYVDENGEQTLEEQTSTDRPFEFITGFGIALDGFEQHVMKLEKGTTFEFTLQPSEAFGDYDPEGVRKVDREFFTIDGKFDHEHVFEGANIPLVDEEGNQFMAKVVKVEMDGVTLDANHPLAGKTLTFAGLVRENREATEQEIQHLIKLLTGGCSGCGGEGCGENGDHCEHHGHEGKGHKGGCGHCHH